MTAVNPGEAITRREVMKEIKLKFLPAGLLPEDLSKRWADLNGRYKANRQTVSADELKSFLKDLLAARAKAYPA